MRKKRRSVNRLASSPATDNEVLYRSQVECPNLSFQPYMTADTTMPRHNSPSARPELYDPKLVALFALLFTPIFGAQLQALNWARLGEDGQVRTSRLWVRASFWLLLLFILMQAIFQHEPLMRFGGIYFLVVSWACWMLTSGYRQITYVKNLYGNDYPKAKIGRPILLGAGGWVIYSMVAVTFGMALALFGYDPAVNTPASDGVTIRVPEGSDQPIVEPLRPLPEAPIPETSGIDKPLGQ